MRLVVIGAGGHGKVVADCADAMRAYSEIVFLDSNAETMKKLADWPVIDVPEAFESLISDNTEFFVAIGNNDARAAWIEKLTKKQVQLATLIHPRAYVSDRSLIGEGTLVLAQAAVNILAEIGIGCIINTGATVDHDCKLGRCVHIAPGVNLAGTVTLKDFVFLGAGVTVIPNISVGEYTTVGAGGTVISDLPAGIVAVGTPARVIKQIER